MIRRMGSFIDHQMPQPAFWQKHKGMIVLTVSLVALAIFVHMIEKPLGRYLKRRLVPQSSNSSAMGSGHQRPSGSSSSSSSSSSTALPILPTTKRAPTAAAPAPNPQIQEEAQLTLSMIQRGLTDTLPEERLKELATELHESIVKDPKNQISSYSIPVGGSLGDKTPLRTYFNSQD